MENKRPTNLYFSPGRYLERLAFSVSKNYVTERDSELIKIYIDDKVLQSGGSLAESRKVKIVNHLTLFSKYFLRPVVEYSTIANGTWKIAAGHLFSNGCNPKGKQFTINTRYDYITIVKGFLRWLVSNGYANNDLTIEGINRVKNPPKQYVTKSEYDLLSDDDVYKLLESSHSSVQLSAMISLLYWTGARISEILSLSWGDLTFEHQLLKIRIYSPKNKNYRYSPCSEALEWVAAWRNKYPAIISGGAIGNNPVFVSYNRKDMKYESILYPNARKQIQLLCKKVLNRHITIHAFRASDITNTAKRGIPDSINKAIHWGNQSTNMLRTYTLLSDSDIDNAMRKRAGIDTEQEELPIPRLCPICGTMNNPYADFCKSCGAALTREKRKRQIEIREASVNAQKEKSVFEAIGILADSLGIDRGKLFDLMGK